MSSLFPTKWFHTSPLPTPHSPPHGRKLGFPASPPDPSRQRGTQLRMQWLPVLGLQCVKMEEKDNNDLLLKNRNKHGFMPHLHHYDPYHAPTSFPTPIPVITACDDSIPRTYELPPCNVSQNWKPGKFHEYACNSCNHVDLMRMPHSDSRSFSN